MGGGKRKEGGEEEEGAGGRKLEGKWTRNYSNLAQISKMEQQEKGSYEIIEEDESDSDSDFGRKAKKIEVVRVVGKKKGGEGGWRMGEGWQEDGTRMEEENWEKEGFDELVRKWEKEEGEKEKGVGKEAGGGGVKETDEGLRRRGKGKTVLAEKINGLSPIKKLHTFQNIIMNGYVDGRNEHDENHNPNNLTRRHLKKMISLPNLWSKQEEEVGGGREEVGGKVEGEGEKEEGGRKRGKKREKTIVYDEVFYYYFDHVLERYLMRMKNRRRLESTD